MGGGLAGRPARVHRHCCQSQSTGRHVRCRRAAATAEINNNTNNSLATYARVPRTCLLPASPQEQCFPTHSRALTRTNTHKYTHIVCGEEKARRIHIYNIYNSATAV